jgi:Ca-activated chloride channel family protein
MGFASPAILIGLLAIPVLVVLYLGHHQRGREAAEGFAARALAPSVTPRRPGWRRHAPMLAVLLALTVLVVAAARPRVTVAVPAKQASIVLATDVSGSMLAADVRPTRLAAARRAALRFVDRVPRKVEIGVVAFNQVPRVLEPPTRDRAAVVDALKRMSSSGATATGRAIETSTRLVRSGRDDTATPPPAAIVLLSDGTSTKGVDPVQAARAAGRRHVPVYTVALGTSRGTIEVRRAHGGTVTRAVPPDPRSLSRIADVSGGRAYTAAGASRLSDVYDGLGSRLGRRKEQRELTAGFAGGALALLALGAASSLRWFGRLI